MSHLSIYLLVRKKGYMHSGPELQQLINLLVQIAGIQPPNEPKGLKWLLEWDVRSSRSDLCRREEHTPPSSGCLGAGLGCG